MAEQEPTKFVSWDGLEEEEYDDLKRTIRDIQNAKVDIEQKSKKSTKKGTSKVSKESKRIEEETKKLMNIVGEWVARPKPAIKPRKLLNLTDHERSIYRRLHALVRSGLQNPIVAKSPEFAAELLKLTQPKHYVDATDFYKPTETPSEDGEEDGPMQLDSPDECLDKDGKAKLKLQMFAREDTPSPPPEFEDMEEEVSDTDTIMLEPLPEFKIDGDDIDDHDYHKDNNRGRSSQSAMSPEVDLDGSDENGVEEVDGHTDDDGSDVEEVGFNEGGSAAFVGAPLYEYHAEIKSEPSDSGIDEAIVKEYESDAESYTTALEDRDWDDNA